MLLGLGKDGPLSPDTQYFYVVGDSADARSEALSFTTPPLTGPESLPYRRAQGVLSVERASTLVNEVERCVLLERVACSGPDLQPSLDIEVSMPYFVRPSHSSTV